MSVSNVTLEDLLLFCIYFVSYNIRSSIMKQIFCPISNEKINERITRLNALIGIVLVILSFVFQTSVFLIFLSADFYVRAFTQTRFSPISYASHFLCNALNLGEKNIDKAPKTFAARLGFLMTLAITILFIAGFTSMAIIIAGILVFFASLEFALALCVGCVIYTYVILPFYK